MIVDVMTVAELIAELQKYPPELQVVSLFGEPASDSYLNPVEDVELYECEVLSFNRETFKQTVEPRAFRILLS